MILRANGKTVDAPKYLINLIVNTIIDVKTASYFIYGLEDKDTYDLRIKIFETEGELEKKILDMVSSGYNVYYVSKGRLFSEHSI